MTLRREDEVAPAGDVGQPTAFGHRQPNNSRQAKVAHDERQANGTRHPFVRVLSTWETTVRLMAVILMVLTVLLVGAWSLGLDVEFGPVRLSSR